MSPRPGFVLEVDKIHSPPLCSGTERASGSSELPTGSRVLYAPEPLDPLTDPVGAIRHALLHPWATPSRCRPCCVRACG